MKPYLGILLFLVLMISETSLAKDDWLCTEEASQIQNGSVLACGVAEGKDENEARSKAFENAKAEFSRVCQASDTCNQKQVSVEPKRTSCESNQKRYKCYRLIIFTIGSEKSKKNNVSINLKETPDPFQSFIYQNTLELPKIRKGMTKKDLLLAFGAPESIREQGEQIGYDYRGKMCVFDTMCSVHLEDDKVIYYDKFKPIYMDDLK